MFAEARIVAAKDLRLEWRSRVTTTQVVPFAVLTLVLFAFAIDPSRGVLGRVAPGLFWVAVLLSTTLAANRAHAVETDAGTRDMLRLSGLEPSAVFAGKAAAIVVQLLGLEIVLAAGTVVLYNVQLATPALLLSAALPATVALGAAGATYGALAASVRVRETLLPLLLLPVLAPVLIAATSATEAAIDSTPEDGWGWAGLLVVLALLYAGAGAGIYGVLLEDQ